MVPILKTSPLAVFIHSRNNNNDDDAVYKLNEISKKLKNKLPIFKNDSGCVSDYCDTLKSFNTYTENQFVICHSEPMEDKLLERKYIWDLEQSIIRPNWFVCPKGSAKILFLMACKGNLIVNVKSWRNKFDLIVTFNEDLIFNFQRYYIRMGLRRLLRKLSHLIGQVDVLDFEDKYEEIIISEISRNMWFSKFPIISSDSEFLDYTLQSFLTNKQIFKA